MLTTHPFDDDHLREECGVFGIFGHPEARSGVPSLSSPKKVHLSPSVRPCFATIAAWVMWKIISAMNPSSAS